MERRGITRRYRAAPSRDATGGPVDRVGTGVRDSPEADKCRRNGARGSTPFTDRRNARSTQPERLTYDDIHIIASHAVVADRGDRAISRRGTGATQRRDLLRRSAGRLKRGTHRRRRTVYAQSASTWRSYGISVWQFRRHSDVPDRSSGPVRCLAKRGSCASLLSLVD